MTCKNCGYENKLGVRYCQRCGQYIEPKRTLAQEVKSLDFRSLAGVGRRDVNIAPLFTASPDVYKRQIYNDPLSYADLILNGDPEEYLKNAAGSHGLED